MNYDYIPRAYQHLITDYIINNPRCGIFVPMGMGKTASALHALSILSLTETVYPVLVIAPLRVVCSVWPEEIYKWLQFSHMTVQVILGTVQERKIALSKKADIYTINYENISWLLEELQGNWPFKVVVCDESTKLKGFRLRQGTQRARAIASIAHKTPRFIELTGTPSPNGLVDVWGQIWMLDRGERLGRSFDAFTQRWFQKSFNGYSITPLPFAQTQIQDKLKNICLSLDAKEYFDIKEPIRNSIHVDLPPSARTLYNEMEKNMFMEIEDHPIEAFNAAARTNKCLQLCNGAAYTGEGNTNWVEVHRKKIEAVEDIIEEAAGMPVLVAYQFVSDLSRLRKAFPKGRVLDKNPKTIKEWNAGKISLLFAHPASAGHGLNLAEGGNILVFFGLNWNLEEHLQIIERIGPVRQLQAGFDRPIFIHYILARKTVDDMVFERLDNKRSVQDILLEALKQRKEYGAT